MHVYPHCGHCYLREGVRDARYTGLVSQLVFYPHGEYCEQLLHLEGPTTRTRFVTSPEGKSPVPHLKVYGFGRFPYQGRATCVGNWCWDMVTMNGEIACRLLNSLWLREIWQCVEAPSVLFDRWRVPRVWPLPFTPELLQEARHAAAEVSNGRMIGA